MIGPVNKNVLSNLTFDEGRQLFVFNKKGIQQDTSGGNPVAQLVQQVGNGGKHAGLMYSVVVPVDLNEGFTYYDNSLNVSFKLLPQFKTLPGRQVQDRLVYPLAGGGKLIYTFKGNGLKEDVVSDGPPMGGSFSLGYKVVLPDSLETRSVDSSGAVGIYSADPALFGNISYGTQRDEGLVAKARSSSRKTHLVFVLPPPSITGPNQRLASASSRFILDGNLLTLIANGLDKLEYPVSFDPSVVVISTADFSAGNNDGNISYPANEIDRGKVYGGGAYTWAAPNAFTNCRVDHAAVAYNGYLYVLSGYSVDLGNYLDDVQYSPIDAGGAATQYSASSNNFTTGRFGN